MRTRKRDWKLIVDYRFGGNAKSPSVDELSGRTTFHYALQTSYAKLFINQYFFKLLSSVKGNKTGNALSMVFGFIYLSVWNNDK